MTDREWYKLLQSNIRSKTFVIQEFVPAEFEPIHYFKGSELKTATAQVIVSPFLTSGKFAGYCTRFYFKPKSKHKQSMIGTAAIVKI
jgi:hypothetical protein